MNATSNAANPKKHNKAEEEQRKTAGKGRGAGGMAPNPGGFKGKGNPGGRRSSAPPPHWGKRSTQPHT